MLDTRPPAIYHLPRRAVVDASTPGRLRQLTALSVLLIIVLAGLLTVQFSRARQDTQRLAVVEEPVFNAASDLYFALNDMDAQLANILLVGDATGLGITREDGLAIYDQRRLQAGDDLERLAAAGVGIRGLLDGLGRYEALAAEAMLQGRQNATAAALTTYRSATTLLRQTLLAQAQAMVDAQQRGLTAGYHAQSRRTTVTTVAVVVVAVLLVAVLLMLQVFLAGRFRRTVNPLVLGACVVMACLVAGSLLSAGVHAHRLHTQKQDAFDSIAALSRARAVGYDANADESRYLLDQLHDGEYERGFLDKTQQILLLPGATLTSYDRQLDAAWQGYQNDHDRVGWGGALGTEFGNITFTGEREAAETTVERFQEYQKIDRQIRSLASSGRRDAAIRLCTSYAPGGSNYSFDRYDKALAQLIDINTRAYDTTVNADLRDLRRWVWAPGVAAIVAVFLLLVGIRPRLAEYR